MKMPPDPELSSFCQRALEEFGGLAEAEDSGLTAFLPPDLSRELDLPEEVTIGGQEYPLLYGSPVLDRLIGLATSRTPLVFGRIKIPYLKKAGFEKLLQESLFFQGVKTEVQSRAETRSTYLDLTCRYLALSDERKEGLIRLGVAEKTGIVIQGLENAFDNQELHYYARDKIPDHFPEHIDQPLASGLQWSKARIGRDLEPFYQSMQRRLKRDVRNTREYYQALAQEMEESLARPNLSPEQKQDRESKIRELPEEAERKVRDLQEKYKIKVKIRIAAMLRLLVDVVQLQVRVVHRKLRRDIHVTWNPLTRALEPLACEQCGSGMHTVHPVNYKSGFRLVCGECLTAN